MQVGDRVRHKKYGAGTVKAVYDKIFGARVLYDSGHETTNSQKRIQVLTSGQGASGASEPARTPTPQPVKRRGSGSATVDYALIERAREVISAEYPDADEVVGRWYGGRAYCEVVKDNAAQIVFYDET